MTMFEPVQYKPAGNETETLLSTLDRIRRTFAWKCSGLDAAGTNATLGPSTITLSGLLKHLALIEDHYFTGMLLGRKLGPPWDQYDASVPDWEWRSAADDSPEDLLALWESAHRGDLIEEYARHTGHADLIRESVDGLVGEDPPQ
jgi:uncharacterized damage-inducible protein DinB